MFVKDGCLRVFKHEALISFGDDVDDCLLDGLQISIFTCGIFVKLITSGNGMWFKYPISFTQLKFTRNFRNVMS